MSFSIQNVCNEIFAEIYNLNRIALGYGEIVNKENIRRAVEILACEVSRIESVFCSAAPDGDFHEKPESEYEEKTQR